MMSIEWESGNVCLVVTRDNNDQMLCNDIKNWEGFTFRESAGGSGRAIKKVSYQSLCKKYRQVDVSLYESLDINQID